jgi:hypothetical protein
MSHSSPTQPFIVGNAWYFLTWLRIQRSWQPGPHETHQQFEQRMLRWYLAGNVSHALKVEFTIWKRGTAK